jgi:hypothetical protein
MRARVREAARFDRSSNVLRYWLGRCEGFEVRGGASGVVREVLPGGDPYVPGAILVRKRFLGTRRVPAASVEWVVPAERLLVVERPEPAPKASRARRRLDARRRIAVAGAASAPVARRVAAAAAAIASLAAEGARVATPPAERLLRRSGLELARLGRALAVAALRGIVLVRSAPWRPFARSARSATTRLSRALSRSSSRRRTTSSPRSSGRTTSRAARTTSST